MAPEAEIAEVFIMEEKAKQNDFGADEDFGLEENAVAGNTNTYGDSLTSDDDFEDDFDDFEDDFSEEESVADIHTDIEEETLEIPESELFSFDSANKSAYETRTLEGKAKQVAKAGGGKRGKSTKLYPTKPEAKQKLESLNLTGDLESKYVDDVSRLVVNGDKANLNLVEEELIREGLIQDKITIESKFAETTQKDNKELGFDWIYNQDGDKAPSIVSEAIKTYLKADQVVAKLEADRRRVVSAESKPSTNPPVDADTALAKSKILFENQEFEESINELEKLLIQQPYNVEANKALAKNYQELRKLGAIRREVIQPEKISEVSWKWNNGPSTSPHSKYNEAITITSRTKTPHPDPSPIVLFYNNIHVSSTFSQNLLFNQQNGQSLKSQLKNYGVSLHPQAKVTLYPEFNRLLIQNDKAYTEQNVSILKQSDQKLQVETKVKPLLKSANELYQKGQYQEAKQKLQELLQIQDNNIEAKKLLLQTDAKLQPKKTQSKLFKNTAVKPMSTFAIDVDTASYTSARRKILNGQRPKPSEIRQEEFLNYFNYNYPAPKSQSFAIDSELLPSPFIKDHHILRIGVQGKRPGADTKLPTNTTFVIDTSGSMAAQSRLPLIQSILPMLLDKMNAKDKVSILSCDINSRLVADRTPLTQKNRLKKSIASLQAVGATNLEQSLLEAYKHAAQHYENKTMNRIVLISDGVANLGETAAQNILSKVEELRKMGITLTVIGMGQGNYNDNFLETLANKADGSYIYIDSYKEAKKAFVDNFSAHFQLIARDVKIQVELDPKYVESYRLIGYDNRRLRNKDFRNDSVDGGEVGAGQSVTALYEIKLVGNAKHQLGNGAGNVDFPSAKAKGLKADWKSALPALGEIRLRFKDPIYKDDVREFAFPLNNSAKPCFQHSSKASRLALLAASFAEYLRGGDYAQGISKKQLNKFINELATEMSYDDSIQELKRLITLTQ